MPRTSRKMDISRRAIAIQIVGFVQNWTVRGETEKAIAMVYDMLEELGV